MKKILIFFTFCLIMSGFASCSNSDDVDVNVGSIVGHWQGVTYQLYEDKELTTLIEEGPSTWDWRLFEDGTCSCKGYEIATNGVYKLLGNEINIYKNSRTNYFVSYYIIQLSKNELKVRYTSGKVNLVVLMQRVA